ncbi:MarR family transcriptional regulator [Sediminivirga luteola]|nr:MarR family transcriptional regulator [Sediminivirga luteola]
MLDPRVIDPGEEMVRWSGIPAEEVDQIVRLMTALRGWREAEDHMSREQRRYMNLGETDMRALRYLIAAHNQGRDVTPRMLAAHLGISTASTTKLLDRLAQAEHIVRRPHPADRRSVLIDVSPATRRAAREGVGRQHARRFEAAARLSPAEREVVTRFLQDLARTGDEG